MMATPPRSPEKKSSVSQRLGSVSGTRRYGGCSAIAGVVILIQAALVVMLLQQNSSLRHTRVHQQQASNELVARVRDDLHGAVVAAPVDAHGEHTSVDTTRGPGRSLSIQPDTEPKASPARSPPSTKPHTMQTAKQRVPVSTKSNAAHNARNSAQTAQHTPTVTPAYGQVMSGPRALPQQVASTQCAPIQGIGGHHPVHALVKGDGGDASAFDADHPTLRPEYVAHLKTLKPIPPRAHISWKTPSIFTSQNKVAVNGVQAIGRLSPMWQVMFYNDSETSRYIKDHIPEADWALIKDRHIVEKVDLFRLLVVYFDGGFYQDIDRLFGKRLGTFLPPQTRMLLPTASNSNFAQDFTFSAPCNTAYQAAIELNLKRRHEFSKNPSSLGPGHEIFVLGPDTFYHSMTWALYGVMLQPAPGDDKMEAIRQSLNQTNGLILTHREEWCDSILFQDPACKSWSRESLYGEGNVQHWGKWAESLKVSKS
eukprot:m.137120 g.137120  ORF g.137120 m.137120 type:complete len:481 (+) comp11455_c0_seq1:226-1668(+)